MTEYAPERKVAEYGDIDFMDYVKTTVIETGTYESPHGDCYPMELVSITAGWTNAGSAARWQSRCCAVYYYIDGARHGRRFEVNAYAEAKAMFDRLKNPTS